VDVVSGVSGAEQAPPKIRVKESSRAPPLRDRMECVLSLPRRGVPAVKQAGSTGLLQLARLPVGGGKGQPDANFTA
jgi:hypothetical protein